MREGRWFGTPVGAALLVGALAACVSMLWVCWVAAPPKALDGHLGFVNAARKVVYFVLLLSAPAVCLRMGSKVFLAIGVGSVCAAPLIAPSFFSIDYRNVVWLIWYLVAARATANALLGYATARIYGIPEVRWKCLLVSAGCSLFSSGLWWLTAIADPRSVFGEMTETSHALQLSLETVSSFLQVVPIAFVIEHYQVRMRKDVSGAGV